MPRYIRHSLTLLTLLLCVVFMASCSQEQPAQKRAAVDALDKETAFARKARISNRTTH
jgi:PBP1b-binding outer membrane lipoprotein LpoB